MLSAIASPLTRLDFSTDVPSTRSHEIDGVARGLGVYQGGRCIVGEGIGIGAPLALVGDRAVFPLDTKTLQSGNRITRRFYMNGLSLKFIGRVRADVPYKWIRSKLAPLYLKSSAFRPIFNYLMAARTVIGLKSHYRRTKSLGFVDVTYLTGHDRVRVEVDASRLGASKFLIANELDGHLFEHVIVDDSTQITKIPPWLEISGNSAKLVAPSLGFGFRLNHVNRCRLFVGREILGGRLNWAGFSYMPDHDLNNFSYEVVFEND